MPSRPFSRPGAIATCTTWSRPNTRPSTAAGNGAKTLIPSLAPDRNLARSSALPSDACRISVPRPVRSHSRALSNPATAWPARRARPKSSLIRRTNAVSSTTGRSGGTRTEPRAALAKARPNPPWARARSITSPLALNQIPRPGSVAVRSGTTALSGPTTKRIIRSFGNRSRVTMHRRRGPVSAASSSAISAIASAVLRLLRRRRACPGQ